MKIFGKNHNQKVLRDLHNQGIEMTPEEVVSERKKAFATIRKEMAARGIRVPDSDEELFLWIVDAQRSS